MSVKTAFESGFEKGLKDLSVKLAQALGIEDSAEVFQDLQSKIAELSGADVGLGVGGALGIGGGTSINKWVAPRVEQFQQEQKKLYDILKGARNERLDLLDRIKGFDGGTSLSPKSAKRLLAHIMNNENAASLDLHALQHNRPFTSKIYNLFGQNPNNIKLLGKSLQGAGAAGLLALLGKKVFEKPKLTE